MLSLLCVPAIVDDEQILWSSVLLLEFEDPLHQQRFCIHARDKIRIGLKVVLVFEDALLACRFRSNAYRLRSNIATEHARKKSISRGCYPRKGAIERFIRPVFEDFVAF